MKLITDLRKIVMILVARRAIPMVLVTSLSFLPTVAWAQTQLNACDLTSDGAVNILDIDLAVNMTLGQASCTANIQAPGVCDVVTVQRVINAVLQGNCVIGSGSGISRTVTLNWTASVSPNVTYNVYRGNTSGGPYTKLNSSPITATSYVDSAALAGQTYYYIATAVDSSRNESVYSNQAQAVIPSQ